MRQLNNLLKILDQEWFKGVLFAVIAGGIVAILFAVWTYYDTTRQLENNQAYQVQQTEEAVQLQTEAQAQGLMASDIARRRLESDRYQAMMIGGIGLAVAAAGWFLLDIAYSRKRRHTAPPAAAEPTASPLV